MMSISSPDCIFCRIINGSARASHVYRDENCIAFLDMHPINAGHVLVCPIRHVSSFTDLTKTEAGAILTAAQHIAKTQRNKLENCRGINLLLSDGEVAGQEVAHTHFHVVPRDKGDGFGWQRFGELSSGEELDLIASRLRDS